MSILKLYQDYNIETAPDDHKHSRPGWINVECPYCSGDNPGYHLGFNEVNHYFYCWRCGGHSFIPTLSKLLHIPYDKAKQLVREGGIDYPLTEKKINPVIRMKVHKLPSDTGKMKANHRRYLERRGYNPEQIERDWGVLGTGPVGQLDGINYKHRILIPIHWNNQEVSFQTRDITNRHKLKYITCPKDRELIFHKHILYGKQSEWTKTGVCVEGVFDVWRLGFSAFCTFGIEYTFQQMRLMSQLFDRVFVIFDPDKQAQRKAAELRAELRFRGLQCENIVLDCDPGELEQSEADYIIKNLMK